MRHGQIELDWADGTYSFRLSIEGLDEIEEKTKASFFETAARLQNRMAFIKDIREVLRVGLIGGGMAPAEALRLVRRYVDERPLDESRDVAYAVALAGLARVYTKDSPSGEAEAARSSASTSPPSTQTD